MKRKIIFVFVFNLIIFFNIISYAYAAYPPLVQKIGNAFMSIKNWIVDLSTPAAAVAVGTGVFMKKFSFGDEERMRTGKKLIRSSLFSYAFIIGIDLILNLVQVLTN